MSRIPLKQGEAVLSPNCKYIIDGVIGDGANGVVYDAHYFDSFNFPHNVRLKECYPYGDTIARNGTGLKWENEEIKQIRLASFKHSYEKLMVRQNSNFTVHVFDLFEANGTSYVAMDANDGLTFDKENFSSLEEILKTVKLLAYVVGEYHKSGYLHLDIKPSNFLVYPRPSEHIVLFDLDSVTAMDDIANGIVKCIPYSKDWAATEQMLGKISKLCPATDIYSIGAILFQKIMGISVVNEDTGIFADWSFTGEMFEKVNPKIKRLLCEIFHKTLAANVKRRYQSADELIEALDKAIETVRQKQYIVSDSVVSGINFVGRREDIQTIHERFADGARAVFVHGFGGIGKTELAKKYAEIYSPEYDAVIFRFYSNSLIHLISHISVANSDKETDIETLKKLCGSSKVLFIIDNFDVDNDKDLEPLLEVNADFIFTRRKNIYEYYASDKIFAYELEELSSSELLCVFKNEYVRETSEKEVEHLIDIFKRFNNWTLIVPIIAKYLHASGMSIEEYVEKLDNDGFSSFGDDSEKIRVRKDGKFMYETQMSILRYVFNLSAISNDEIQTLCNLYVLKGLTGLSKKQYKDYSAVSNLNALNNLIYLKWVNWDKENDIISVHPLIYELVKKDLNPNSLSCKKLLDNVSQHFIIKYKYSNILSARESYLKDIEDAQNRLQGATIVKILNSLDYYSNADLEYIIKCFCRCFQGDLYRAQYCICDEVSDMFISLEKVSKLVPRDSVFYYEFGRVFFLIGCLYCIGTNEVWLTDKNMPKEIQTLTDVFQNVVDKLKSSKSEDAGRQLYLFIKPYMQGITNLKYRNKLSCTLPNDIFETACSCIDYINSVQNRDNELVNDFISYYFRIKQNMANLQNVTQDSLLAIQRELQEVKRHPSVVLLEGLKLKNNSKVKAVSNVLTDMSMSTEEKNNAVESAFNEVFHCLKDKSKISGIEREKYEWKSFIEPLELHAEFFDKYPLSSDRLGSGKFDLKFNISRCRLAYIYAMSDDEQASTILSRLYSQIEDRHLSSDSDTWWNDKSAIPRFYVDFDVMLEIFSNLHKSYLILPFLIQYSELIKQHFSLLNLHGEKALFQWYSRIVNCAEDAHKETGDNRYKTIANKYKKIITEIISQE